MNPEAMLALARYLAAVDPPEGCEAETLRRASVSRAYYAAYTATRQLLENGEGITFHRDDASHAQVRDKFKGQDPLRRQVFELLFRLFKARCRADYEPALVPTAQDVNDAIEQTQVILQRVESLWGRVQSRER